MDKSLLKQYILSLNTESGKNVAKNYGVNLTNGETNILLKFLKDNINYLDIKNKTMLLTKLKKEIPLSLYLKAELLLNKIIK